MGANMKLQRKPILLNNERGTALIETVPLLVIFMMLISFGLGLFGYIHSAVLYSISARTYAFETFRNRTNLTYFRENGSGLFMPLQFSQKGIRYHAITSRDGDDDKFVAKSFPIKIGQTPEKKGSSSTHTDGIFTMQPRNQSLEVSPAWLMIGYGMCTNYSCGDR